MLQIPMKLGAEVQASDDRHRCMHAVHRLMSTS